MNIYLDNAGTVKNCKYVKRISHMIGLKERIDLFLKTDRRISLIGQMMIVICTPSIKTIQLTIPVSKLSGILVWFANHFPRYSLKFIVDQPLSKRKWKKICRLKDVIYINDISYADHTKFYKNVHRAIYKNDSCDIIHTMDTYSVAVKMPMKQCEYSSCLGKTVYISKEGNVSFCMEHPKETYMGKIEEIKELFHTTEFLEKLKKMIARRSQCGATCSHFHGCMGGCVFWEDCSEFQKDCDEAVKDIVNLIENEADLSKLPIYQERSIIYRLFSRKPYSDSFK